MPSTTSFETGYATDIYATLSPWDKLGMTEAEYTEELAVFASQCSAEEDRDRA